MSTSVITFGEGIDLLNATSLTLHALVEIRASDLRLADAIIAVANGDPAAASNQLEKFISATTGSERDAIQAAFDALTKLKEAFEKRLTNE